MYYNVDSGLTTTTIRRLFIDLLTLGKKLTKHFINFGAI